MTIQQSAKVIGRCVNRKVRGLQKAYLSGSASARASLARLRRLDTAGEMNWMMVGDDIFTDLPDLDLGQAAELKEMLSIRASMKTYAMLQQSRNWEVASFPEDGSDVGSFGKACGLMAYGDSDDGDAGVRRRLTTLESARDFRGVETSLRALVQLMRSKNPKAKLDFGLLASDLYQIQFDETRQDVYERWARDYYRAPSSNSAAAKNEDN